MAATQAQRAALYVSLVDSMGEEAADTLMDQLPPSGWDQMATKEDLAGVEQRLQASLAVAFAEINARFAETNVKFVEGHAALQVAMHEGFARGRQRAVRDNQGPGQAALCHRLGHRRGHNLDLDSPLHQRRRRIARRGPLHAVRRSAPYGYEGLAADDPWMLAILIA